MRVVVGIDLRTDGHSWLIQRALAWGARGGASIDLVNFGDPTDTTLLPRLQTLLQTLPESHRGKARVVNEAPAEGLVSVSKTTDLLVVGSREPAALERWIHGPMATRVLRQAQCAVLVPRSEDPPAAPARLLCGVDIGAPEAAERVMRLAVPWASRFDGKMGVVFALASRLPHIQEKDVRERAEREWEALHSRERDALQALLDAHVPVKWQGPIYMRRGEPDDAMVQASTEADLVIVGNREREGLARLLGTVAQRVARNATSDVLSLPTATTD